MTLGVAILGATGMVGQRFVQLLDGHPEFEVKAFVGDSSAGKAYGDAVQWQLASPLPAWAAKLPIIDLATFEASVPRDEVQVAFSALPSGKAGAIESRLAALGLKVFTNAADHRMGADVPLLIPEVNAEHVELVRRQPGPGWIVANGNCTAIILALALAPLRQAFGLEEVHVTTMQGLSGAGLPGIASLDIADNLLPLISGEEEKVEAEPQKTLGALRDGRVAPAGLPIHATCTRSAVREGHVESVHARLARPATAAGLEAAWRSFRGPPELAGLRTAPRQPVHVAPRPDRPQPRLDRDAEGGMAVTVGRIRVGPDGRGVRFVLLGHNTVRGAAGQCILNAEFARARGLL